MSNPLLRRVVDESMGSERAALKTPVYVLLFTSPILAGITVTLLAVGCREKPAQGDSIVKDVAESSPDDDPSAVEAGDGSKRNPNRKRPSRRNRRDKAIANIGYVDFALEPAAADESGVVFIDPERSYPG